MNDDPLALTTPLDNRLDNRLDNIAVLRGNVSNDPQRRALPAGRHVVQFDVTTRLVADARDITVSVPVAWYEPSAAALSVLSTGVELLVIGTVRRRFFRVGGATQSRTEVVADSVLPTRRRKQVALELQRAADRLLAE